MSIENPTLAHFRHFSSLYFPLHLSRILYKSPIFMQNKPNLVRRRRIANSVYTTDYENKWQRKVRKNKPNSNPIKANFQKAKMNVNSLITKDYRKKDDFVVRINKAKTNPISKRPKMNVSSLITKDYRKNDAIAVQKNKPNSNPILVDSCWSLSCTEFTPHFDAGMRGCGDARQE